MMNQNKFSWALFSRVPVIGIIRNMAMEDLFQVMQIFEIAGLTTIEITMNTPGAEEMIRYGVEKYGTDLNIGAGTVCTKKDLEKAIAAGAQFIVTPVVRKKLIKACVEQDIPIFPGAMTPTEIYKAWKAGASMVKVFPAKALGAGYIKDVKAPLHDIKLAPTGGIDLDNVESFKDAGADAFGIGSPLFKKDLIAAKDWGALQEHFKKIVDKLSIVA